MGATKVLRLGELKGGGGRADGGVGWSNVRAVRLGWGCKGCLNNSMGGLGGGGGRGGG